MTLPYVWWLKRLQMWWFRTKKTWIIIKCVVVWSLEGASSLGQKSEIVEMGEISWFCLYSIGLFLQKFTKFTGINKSCWSNKVVSNVCEYY